MPRGGKRDGAQGKAYAQRTDLGNHGIVAAQPQNQPGAKLAIQAASGQAYGAAAAQKASQAAVPMASSPLQTSSGTPQPNTPQAPIPGTLGDLTGPTDRPDEHLMTGVGQPSSAPTPADPNSTALALLNSLGDNVSPQVAYLRNYLQLQTQNQMPH